MFYHCNTHVPSQMSSTLETFKPRAASFWPPSVLSTLGLPFALGGFILTTVTQGIIIKCTAAKEATLQPATLYTISFSHYVVRARWFLNIAEVPYVEISNAPVLHWTVIRKATGGKSQSVPILVLPSRKVLPSSDAILDHIVGQEGQSWLIPTEEAKALCDELSKSFGVAVRAFGYMRLMSCKEGCAFLKSTLMRTAPTFWQKVTIFLPFPAIRGLMIKHMCLDRVESYNWARGVIIEVFDQMDKLLADGRPFLAGNRVSALDVTFASLAYPVLLPDETQSLLGDIDDPRNPVEFKKAVLALRSTKAGQHALKLFKDAGAGAILPK
ncbi:hypothetical protein HK104_003436 [Borealophlyctis nickersoniae]|nr:hypothetical protein HK104_003436 [Borealophlyctis nickersoniae]